MDSPRFGIGSLTEAEVDIRMAPPPRACISGTAALTILSALNSSSSAASCHAAIVERDGGAGRRSARIGEQQIDAAEPLRCARRPSAGSRRRTHFHRHREHVAPDARRRPAAIACSSREAIETFAPSRASASPPQSQAPGSPRPPSPLCLSSQDPSVFLPCRLPRALRGQEPGVF